MNASTISIRASNGKVTLVRVKHSTQPPEVNEARCQIAITNPAYPPELLKARRAEFARQIQEHNTRAMLEARLSETTDPEEQAEILIQLEKE